MLHTILNSELLVNGQEADGPKSQSRRAYYIILSFWKLSVTIMSTIPRNGDFQSVMHLMGAGVAISIVSQF